VYRLSVIAPVMKIVAWTPWSTSQSTIASASPTRPLVSKVNATWSVVRGKDEQAVGLRTNGSLMLRPSETDPQLRK
jgi:hypothetical protein